MQNLGRLTKSRRLQFVTAETGPCRSGDELKWATASTMWHQPAIYSKGPAASSKATFAFWISKPSFW